MLLGIYFIFKSSNTTMTVPAIPVVAGAVTQADVPIYIAALGTVTPVSTVAVQTQVNGLLMKVLFKEGDVVKQGQL